jgi:two-component system cell cycle sensor histidine kinase/response regulator CckA
MSARILYLDDEEPLVFIVKRMLEHLGHKVSGFTSSDAALAAFKAAPQDFELVLSDMSMPGMSGIEFATEVLAVRPDTLVVLVSGFVEPKDAERARAVGVRHVVRKPNTIAELKELVSGLLPT